MKGMLLRIVQNHPLEVRRLWSFSGSGFRLVFMAVDQVAVRKKEMNVWITTVSYWHSSLYILYGILYLPNCYALANGRIKLLTYLTVVSVVPSTGAITRVISVRLWHADALILARVGTARVIVCGEERTYSYLYFTSIYTELLKFKESSNQNIY